MAKWLERAKRENLNSLSLGTAVTAERIPTSVLAVTPLKKNDILGVGLADRDPPAATPGQIPDEVERIVDVWRRTVGLKLDPARVREHLDALKRWENKLRNGHQPAIRALRADTLVEIHERNTGSRRE